MKNPTDEVNKAIQSRGQKMAEDERRITVNTYYADNVPYVVDLLITVYPQDWSEIEKQQCYQDLMAYLHSLGIREKPDDRFVALGSMERTVCCNENRRGCLQSFFESLHRHIFGHL